MRGSYGFERLKRVAVEETKRCVSALPEELRNHATVIGVSIMRRPDRAMVDDGVEPDLLGLFIGKALVDEYAPDMDVSPRIILFAENLWDYCEGDIAEYRTEVRITYLHELGHYLGLNEGELDNRGLA